MSQPKRASKRKHRACAVPLLGAAGLSLSLATGASAATEVPADIPTQNTWVNPEITLAEEEISDVSLATFYVFDKENPGTSRPGLLLAGKRGGGGGGGCRGCGGGKGCKGCGGGHGHGCKGCGGGHPVTAAKAAAAAAEVAEVASGFGGGVAAAAEGVQAAIGAGGTAFESGAIIDITSVAGRSLAQRSVAALPVALSHAIVCLSPAQYGVSSGWSGPGIIFLSPSSVPGRLQRRLRSALFLLRRP